MKQTSTKKKASILSWFTKTNGPTANRGALLIVTCRSVSEIGCELNAKAPWWRRQETDTSSVATFAI